MLTTQALFLCRICVIFIVLAPIMSGTASAEHSDSGDSPAQWSSLGGESPAPARNPSPPRELIGLNDSIGSTAFSQHWLFSTLMKLIQVSTCGNANPIAKLSRVL